MYLHVLVLPFLLSWLLLAAQPTQATTTNITANIIAVTNSSFFIPKNNDCPKTCGNVTVPYPFGIGSDCFISPWFNLTCDNSSYPPRLSISNTDIEVRNISQTQVWTSNLVSASQCYDNTTGNGTTNSSNSIQLGAPYSFSDTANMFTVVGCGDYGGITRNDTNTIISGCLPICENTTTTNSNTPTIFPNKCIGIGCCQIDVPKGLNGIYPSIWTIENHIGEIWSTAHCTYAFIGEKDYFQFNGTSDLSDPLFNGTMDRVPTVLDFVVGNQNCGEAQNSNGYLCKGNTSCNDVSGGYLCSCNFGYEGNPYIGCTDINECALTNSTLTLTNCSVHATCHNNPGNFSCSCDLLYVGDGTNCISLKLPLGLCLGFLLFLIGATWLYFSIKRRKLIKLREQFFQQNGGLLMLQKISSIDGTSADSPKIFTAAELKKATNNYAENRILGHGGSGVVYKGILPDERVVAVKKSRVMNGNQVEQFINELLIVTQVNHRNVVKLLGCCFESEVPELVYEYIPNGTLFEHIHKPLSQLTLENRLRIAVESASALSYLHSDASISIIHRDVKSVNILLDDNYVAKVADFGASRFVPLDQTQVTTLVQGTLGYLDPEYFQTSQLTEKSDVYSFGVVLVELLTGKKPIDFERSEGERHLATHFIVSMKEKRLFQILEPRVVREGTLEQLEAIAELVKRCLCLESEKRPTMKEVVTELERLRKYKKQPYFNQQRHEESEEVVADIYTVPISPTSGEDLSYGFNISMTLPLNTPR